MLRVHRNLGDARKSQKLQPETGWFRLGQAKLGFGTEALKTRSKAGVEIGDNMRGLEYESKGMASKCCQQNPATRKNVMSGQ